MIQLAKAGRATGSRRNRFQRRLHLVGAGGAGMSGLARIYQSAGSFVTGSDRARSANTDSLRLLGIRIVIGHRMANLPAKLDCLVRSAAVGDDNSEVAEALRRGVPVLSYARALGELLKDRRGVVVAGTHGKTTTSAMLAGTLCRGGFSPSYLVGGTIPELGGNAALGRGPLFVAEACEYDRSFLNLRPEAAVITNVEAEHLDSFPGGLEEILDAFSEFVSRLRHCGVLVVPEGLRRRLVASTANLTVVTTGESPGADWRAVSIRQQRGCYSFRAEHRLGDECIPIRLGIPGRHNVNNALGAAALLHHLGIPGAVISEGLSRFRGVTRRFERRETSRGVTLIDDYAHHPTEVRAVLATARECSCQGRLWVVFQPHLPERVRSFRDEFALELVAADKVVVSRTYGARGVCSEEETIEESLLLSRRILDLGGDSVFLPDHESTADYLGRRVRFGDTVLLVGAGDITLVGKFLATQL